jgi:Tol biopolymer transport system component
VWSPDGRSLYLAAAREPEGALEAWAVDVASGQSRRIEAPAPGEVLQVSVTREGAPVLAVYDLHVRPGIMPVGGGVPRPVLPVDAPPGFLPSWSPDGRTLAYTTGSWRRRTFPRGLDIAALPLDASATPSGPPRILIAEDHEDYGVDWSPDGRFLAFHSHRGDTDDVYLRPARPEDGSIVALSSLGPGHETGEPTWSPGGRQVVFSSFTPDSRTGRSRLFTVEVDPETGRPTGAPQVVPMEGFEGDALGGRYSPDGHTLSFHARWADGSAGVCTVPVTGGRVRTVVRHRATESYSAPEWSRDGNALFFASEEGSPGLSRIRRVHLKTGRVMTLSQGETHVFHPRLSPDGRSLAVTLWRAHVEFWRLPPPP